MTSRAYQIALLGIVVLVPFLFTGAICSRALEIPIVVKASLPNKKSHSPFKLDLSAALLRAGITPHQGRIPNGVAKTITIFHKDQFDVRKEKEILQYGDKLETVYINKISIKASENTLNISLPPINLKISELPRSGLEPNAKSYISVGEIAGLSPKKIGLLPPLVWIPEGLPKFKKILKTFAIGFLLETTIKLKPGDPWPTGSATFSLKFEFAFVINPI